MPKTSLDKRLKKLEEPAKTEELAEENEHLKTTLQLLSEKEATKRCDELGIKNDELRNDFIAHPEKISAYAKGLKKEGQNTPSGFAPLSEKQGYYGNTSDNAEKDTPLVNKKYPSYEAMIQDLHDREYVFQGSQKGVEATQMLEALTRKFFEGHKATNSPVQIHQPPTPKLITVNGMLVPEDASTGDLQERNRALRRRKLLEREERGSVNIKGEEK
jgi:hypothetical protein